jgi:sulfite reductase (ferredoxin)
MTEEIKVVKTLDCKGECCPTPYIKSKRILSKLRIGEILKIIVDQQGPHINLPKSLAEDGHTILSCKQVNETDWEIIVKKDG